MAPMDGGLSAGHPWASKYATNSPAEIAARQKVAGTRSLLAKASADSCRNEG